MAKSNQPMEDQPMTSTSGDQIYCLKYKSKTDTLESQEVVLKNC